MAIVLIISTRNPRIKNFRRLSTWNH